MPTYTCTIAEGAFSQDRKAEIARRITQIHSEVTGAPAYFAQVIFNEVKAGNHFMGGVPLAHDTLFVHGCIRGGRSPEIKHTMLVRMTAALSDAAGLPATGISIYFSELAAQQMVEFGHVLPEPGQEQAWNEGLPAHDRDFMAKIGRS